MKKILFCWLVLSSSLAFAQWTEPVAMQPVLGNAVLGPWISNDGLRLYTAAGGNLYVIERDSIQGLWQQWHSVSATINSGIRQESPCESPTGDTLYFMSYERPEGCYGGYDIYYSVRTDTGWGPVINCGPNINTADDEWSVGITRDGTMLLVSAYQRPVSGGFDLYYSMKQEDGTWGPLINFGWPVSSTDSDEHPTMSPDNNTIYYYIVGYHMGDIWECHRIDGVWQPRTSLPAPINTLTNRESNPCISADGRTLWFVRTVSGLNTLYYSNRIDDAKEQRQGLRLELPKLNVHWNEDRLVLSVKGLFPSLNANTQLYDLLGRQTAFEAVKFSPTATGAQGFMQVGSLPAGTYFVRINHLSHPLTAKVIIP